MDRKVRIGVLGVGVIIRNFHLPSLVKNPRVEVIAACEVADPTALQSVACSFGIPRTYTDFAALAGDPDVDAVVIGLPNYLHAPVAIQMMQAGKHVLCEKPMATTVADAQAMADVAASTRRKLMIAYPWRSDVEMSWLRDVVNSGRLGQIFWVKAHSVTANRWGPPPGSWRLDRHMAGGGVLIDVGAHTLDAVSFLFRDQIQPVKVQAKIGRFFGAVDVEDTATATIEYDTGLVVEVDAGWYHHYAPCLHGALEVYGTAAYARVLPAELHATVEGAWGVYRPAGMPSRVDFDASLLPTFAAQIDNFVDAILLDKPAPCDGRQGVRDMVLLEAAYRSAQLGTAVAIG